MLQVLIKREDSFVCISLQGRFDGLGAAHFDKEVEPILPSLRHLILDFQNVDYLSSVGIRSLIKVCKETKAQKGQLFLVGPKTFVKSVLEISGLLTLFQVVEDLEQARKEIEDLQKREDKSHVISLSQYPYQFHLDQERTNTFEIWSSLPSEKEGHPLTSTDVYSLSLEELGPSFGFGGLGAEPTGTLESLGPFLSLGGTAGVVPADGHNQADYMTLSNPQEAFVHIADVVSFGGHPSGRISIEGEETASLFPLMDDVYQQLAKRQRIEHKVFGLLFLITLGEGNTGSFYKTLLDLQENKKTKVDIPKGKKILGIGLYGPPNWESHSLMTSFFHRRKITPQESFFIGSGLVLSGEEDGFHLTNTMDPSQLLTGSRAYPESVLELASDVTIERGEIWLYLPTLIRRGEEKLLTIEVLDESTLPREWEIITRRLYAHQARVVMEPLKGGFSPAKPFRVTGYDHKNRRTLPTVVKVGPKEEVTREYQAYKKYVENFILNNSTSIMGMSEHGESMGICYNFVGISGPESRLTWLTHIYRDRPVQELLPLFDKIFTDILKPWYGQPQLESLRLFHQHSPLGLFPKILEDGEEILGISPDEKTIYCPYLDMELPNPYHFLKYTYSARAQEERLWYSGINHGDLNMQNILLDEENNIYIIDFSETGSRNILSDFARLEPILRLELTRLEDEKDLKNLLEFELGLSRARSLSQDPSFTYSGDDPLVGKGFQMISRLRSYAKKVVIFEEDLIPYLLAILEWVYPIVSYTSADFLTKKLGFYSAALMIKQIQELEEG